MGATVVQFRTLDPVGGIPNIGLTQVYTTGTVFYVDSNYGNDTWDGLTPGTALATLSAALSKSTANVHDVIYLMPLHAENIAGGLTISADGVEIISVGSGMARAKFTFITDVAACIFVTANDVTFRDVQFDTNIDNQVYMIGVASAQGFTAIGCEFQQTHGKEALIAISLQDGHWHNVINCRFTSAGVACTSGIYLGYAGQGWQISGNYMWGSYSDAGIENPAGTVLTDLSIQNNFIGNTNSGDHAIELKSACTGMIADNRLYGDTIGAVLDPGSCICFNNECNDNIDQGSRELPTSGDSVTGIYSDTTVIASDTLVLQSVTSDILSDTTILTSDTTAIHSQSTVILSDAIVIKSAASDILSDTTILTSDSIIISSDTVVIESQTTKVLSDTTAIHTAVAGAYSDTAIIYSDTTVIASDTLIIKSVTSDLYSDTTIIYSDTTIIYSDTSIIYSDTTVLTSDTAVIEARVREAGTLVAITGTFNDNTLTNNTQVVTLATATGNLYIEEIIIEKDATLLAGPTNVEVSVDNVYGNTGVNDPVVAIATASLGAQTIVRGTAAAVTALVPFVLEDTKKIFAHGSDAAGTSAGAIRFTIIARRLAAGASIA